MATPHPSAEIWKKWRRGGFCAVSHWPDAQRVIVDIGSFNVDSGKVISATQCFIPTYDFMSYLRAEVFGYTKRMFPTLGESGFKHGITHFGGRGTARVFKIEDWNFDAGKRDEFNPASSTGTRRFKCGNFEIKAGSTSSEPDYSKKISLDSIQMKPEELATLFEALVSSVNGYEAAFWQSGKARDEFTGSKKSDD